MKGAIFDMDGLLLDTEKVYQQSWLETAKAFGQKPMLEFAAAISGTNDEIQRQVIQRYYPQVDAWAFQSECIARTSRCLDAHCPPPKPGAWELLRYFRSQGIKTALASSSAVDRIRANLRQWDGLLELFDVIASGQQVERGKPEPDIFLLAAREMGCPPEECYVFEDSLNGIRAGLAAKCRTVMVPDLVQPPEDLHPDRICRTLLEAKELIEQKLL